MNICTEFGIWLRTLSSSSSGGVASRLAMRKPVMDSSLQSWCVASPFGRTFLHNLCRHYLTEQFYLRSGGRISGPHCKSDALSCPASHTLMPDNERLFLVEMPDKTSRMFYWPQTEKTGQENASDAGACPQPALALMLPDIQEEAVAGKKAAAGEARQPKKPDDFKGVQAFMKALCACGFIIDEATAGQALALLVSCKKVQLIGDCLADAHFAKKTIKSLLPEGFCPELICSSPDRLTKQEDFQKKPWPVLRLESGDRVPENRGFDLLDEKELLDAFGKADIKPNEQLNLFDRLHSQVKAQGQTLPLGYRRDLLDYLNHAACLPGLLKEDILAFAWTAFAEPWLLRQSARAKTTEP